MLTACAPLPVIRRRPRSKPATANGVASTAMIRWRLSCCSGRLPQMRTAGPIVRRRRPGERRHSDWHAAGRDLPPSVRCQSPQCVDCVSRGRFTARRVSAARVRRRSPVGAASHIASFAAVSGGPDPKRSVPSKPWIRTFQRRRRSPRFAIAAAWQLVGLLRHRPWLGGVIALAVVAYAVAMLYQLTIQLPAMAEVDPRFLYAVFDGLPW